MALERTDGNDDLLRWLVPTLICIAIALGWSNHFGNGFHWDDFPRIVNNPAVQTLSDTRGFFTRPTTSSQLSEQAEYRPLLTTFFALDRAVAGAEPFVFQVDTFLWFVLLILALYVLVRVLPGNTPLAAALGVGVFALHPAVADTINYISRRGTVLAAFGVAAGLAIRIIWPARLPERLWVDTRRTTTNWQEELLIARAKRLNAIYRRFIHLPLGLYLIPVAFAMLADPAAAIFAPLLAVYLALFDRQALKVRTMLPAALLCGGYFIFATAMTWRYGAATRISIVPWVLTQTAVAARDLFHFLLPVNFSPDSGLKPLRLADWPLALAGISTVVCVAMLAFRASRLNEWRTVAFGLWWFLIALLPATLVPGSMAEANHRMFLPFIGLALALTGTAWLLAPRTASLGVPKLAAGFAFFGLVLTAGAWGVYERNKIWQSEDTLWETATRLSPNNGRAWVRAADVAYDNASYAIAREDLHRAEPLALGDAALETELALAFDRLGADQSVQKHFQLASEANANYARALSARAQWLFTLQRKDEAGGLAERAARLDPADATAGHTLIDVYSQRSDWAGVKAAAQGLLRIYPEDETASRALVLAESTFGEIDQLSSRAKAQGSTADYLRLSALFFRNKRYRDSIDAARAALKINPNLGEAWANISAAQHAMGQDDDAIASLKELIRLRPDLTFAPGDLAYLQSHKGEAAGR